MHGPDSERRCLTVDAMGTLVRLAPPAPALRQELASRFGIELSLAQCERAITAEIGYYRAHMQDGRDEASVQALRCRCAGALREALPVSDRLRQVSGAALTDALLASLRFSLFDDAPAAVLAARERGEQVVVISNWDVSLSDVFGQLGLAPLLDGVVTSAGARARKPDPAIFAAALEVAGVRPAQALHVGDSLEEDVAGARAAGIPVVWLNRPGPPAPPGPPDIRAIASLTELARLP